MQKPDELVVEDDKYASTRIYVVLATSLCMFGLLGFPVISGKVFTVGDLWVFYLPVRYFYARCLATGDSPIWFPNQFSGYYLHGTGQVGMFHPLHYLLYKSLPFTVAYDLEIFLAYPVMFGGMYLFLRRWSGGKEMPLMGAFLFTFSTFNLLRLIHLNALEIIAHFPWLLLCIHGIVATPFSRRALLLACGLAALISSELLLGYPQYFWFAILLMAAYVAVLRFRIQLSFGRLALLLAALVFGIGAGAVQLVPTFEAQAESVRALSPHWNQYEASVAGSTLPQYLFQAIAPYSLPVSHQQRVYIGAMPLLLSIWALVRWRTAIVQRPLIVGAAILVVITIWLATGKYGYLYLLQTKLPVIGGFRYPSRYMALSTFGCSILAAWAYWDIVRLGSGKSTCGPGARRVLAVVVVASAGLAALLLCLKSEQARQSPAGILVGPILIGGSFALLLMIMNKHRWAAALVAPLVAVDTGYYGVSYFGHQDNLEHRLSQFLAPSEDKSFRLVGGNLEDLVASTMLGWRRIDGHDGLPPYRLLDYRDLKSLRVAGVKWVNRTPGLIHGFSGEYEIFDTSAVLPLLGEAKGPWYEIKDSLPRARCLVEARVSTLPGRDIEKIDVAKTALVDRDLPVSGSEPGVAEVRIDRPGHLLISVEVGSPQLLVINESFSKNWHIETSAGKVLEPVRAYGDFLGCVVHPGDGQIDVVFRPRSLWLGMVISIICGSGILLIPIVVWIQSLMHGGSAKKVVVNGTGYDGD